jgi:hypothetical protein
VLPPSESDSSSGGDDYDVEFREAAGHRETYSQNVEREGSGEKRTTTDVIDDDDLYHSEQLKSPISTITIWACSTTNIVSRGTKHS